MKAFLVGESKIDWPTFLEVGKQAFDRHLAKELDQNNKPLDHSGFLSVLHNMRGDDSISSHTLPFTSHLSFTFVFIVEYRIFLTFLEQEFHLHMFANKVKHDYVFCVVSGTLHEWTLEINRKHVDSRLDELFKDCKRQINIGRKLLK